MGSRFKKKKTEEKKPEGFAMRLYDKMDSMVHANVKNRSDVNGVLSTAIMEIFMIGAFCAANKEHLYVLPITFLFILMLMTAFDIFRLRMVEKKKNTISKSEYESRKSYTKFHMIGNIVSILAGVVICCILMYGGAS